MSREEKSNIPSEPHGTVVPEAASDPNAEPTRPFVVEPHVRSELAQVADLAEKQDLERPRTSDAVLPPAPESSRRHPSVPPLAMAPAASSVSSHSAQSSGPPSSRKFPSVPPSIRPSVTTMPPRPRAAEGNSILSSLFWGALAVAFGASGGAVYWELTEEPPHSTLSNAASVAAPRTFANMPPMERRRNERVTEWLPVRLDAGTAGLAVTHNVSETGALLVTAQTLQVGQVVRIIATPADSEAILLEARVVRFAPNAEDPDGLWPYSVAVEFTKPSPELEAALRRLVP